MRAELGLACATPNASTLGRLLSRPDAQGDALHRDVAQRARHNAEATITAAARHALPLLDSALAGRGKRGRPGAAAVGRLTAQLRDLTVAREELAAHGGTTAQ